MVVKRTGETASYPRRVVRGSTAFIGAALANWYLRIEHAFGTCSVEILTRITCQGSTIMESGPLVRRKRRWKLPLAAAAAIVALLVAPSVITRTGILPHVVKWAVPELDGRLDYGAVNVSWFSPVEVHQIELRDLDGEPIFKADHVRTARTLWGLLTHPSDIGLIQIASPNVVLRVSDDSSNAEELLAALDDGESSPSSSSSSSSSVEFQIDNGTLVIHDVTTDQSWQFTDLMVNCRIPSDLREPLQGAIFSQLSDGQVSGKIRGQFQIVRPEPGVIPATVDSPLPPAIGAGTVTLETNGFPMNLANLGLSRWNRPGAMAGYVDSKIDCQWGETNGRVAASAVGQVDLSDAQFAFPDLIGDDQLNLQAASLSIDGSIENNLVSAKSLTLTTDYGRVRFAGTAPLSELTSNDLVGALLSPQTQNRYTLDGRIDLAGLLAALPDSFQVRDGTTITSGNLEFNVASGTDGEQRTLTGKADGRDLAANRGGQSFRWSQPVQIDFRGHADHTGFHIETATCNSDFLQASATGQIEEGSLKATADLNRLMTELGQFFDLQGTKLAGSLDAMLQWSRVDAARFQCGADLRLQEFAYIAPDQQAWKEPLLTVDGQAIIDVQGASVHAVEAGQVVVTAGTDSLTATLTHPVADVANDAWPLNVSVSGGINNWLTRLRPWYQSDSWSLEGELAAEVRGSFSPTLVNVEEGKATIQNMDFAHSSLRVQESLAQFEGVASWDGKTGLLTAPWFTLAATTLSLRGEQVEVQTAGEAITASGHTAFRADIEKVYRWTQDPNNRPTDRTRGTVEGRIQARTQDSQVAFQITSTLRDFAYELSTEYGTTTTDQFAQPSASPWMTVWSESSLAVNSKGVYDGATDHLVFEAINLVGEALQVEAAGQLTGLSIAPHADVTGKLTYDLQQIVSRLKWEPLVQLFGRQTHPFAIQGPLAASSVKVSRPIASVSPVPDASSTPHGSMHGSPQSAAPVVPPELNARATFGWEAASIYGVSLGPGQLTAQLSQGVVVSSPLDVQVGTSQLRVSPAVYLNTDPMTAVLQPGTVAQQVQITPEMCRGWLRYIAPLLSDAASAQGTFSVDLTSAQVPVSKPMDAAVNGRLTIHEARVQPGPLAAQLVAVTDQVTQLIGQKKQNLDFLSADKSWMELHDDQIEFQMQQQRVYHRNLSVDIGKVRVVTEGWVGMDESMALMASIPVMDEWVEGEALLQGLRGQSLTIPIHGTFSRPQIDQRAIAQLSKDLVGGAAQNYLQNELQRGLQKLIQGK